MNINRKLQDAADDIGIIADMMEELYQKLDRFYEEHNSEICARLELAWPKHSYLGPTATKTLRKLADQLAPPED